MSRCVFCLLFLCVSCGIHGEWAESTLEKMTLEEKIGQLFFIPACQLREEDHRTDLYRLIEKYHVGGLILKQGTARGQLALLNELQGRSQIPLLVVQDAEWGLSMRLTDTLRFPKNLTLGAIQDTALIFQCGQEIGRECKLVGAHVNLAPVVDVNSNPKNPIIHMRSFGENPERVAECALAFMQGMERSEILACAKHFPGHGDTSVDSHSDLPQLAHSLERIEAVDLLPFRRVIDAGVFAVMTAHLSLPSLAEEQNLPATLSKAILTDLLRKKMGFNGLIISDALNMQALARYYTPEEIALKAYRAGNDALLYGDHIAPNIDQIMRVDVPLAFAAIKKAFEEKALPLEELDRRVLKLLKAKEKMDLHKQRCLPLSGLEKLNTPEARALKKELYRQAVTLLGCMPPQVKKAALIELGKGNAFVSALKQHISLDVFSLAEAVEQKEKIKQYPLLILSVYDLKLCEANFGLSSQEVAALAELEQLNKPLIVALFDTPYALPLFKRKSCCLVGYEKDPDAEEAVAAVICGKLIPTGHLPVTYER